MEKPFMPVTRKRSYRRLIFALGAAFALAGCAQPRSTPQTSPPPIGNGYPEKLNITEPGPQEVVVIINDNTQMVHAGLFAGAKLLDPAGSYEGTRRLDSQWPGPSLQDYVRFQLEDGPVVKLYRVTLSAEHFAQVKTRMEAAGRAVPLFCAAKVQNILSGIGPFAAVPDAWLVSPAVLAGHLDKIVAVAPASAACYWPNGASCNPGPRVERFEAAKQ